MEADPAARDAESRAAAARALADVAVKLFRLAPDQAPTPDEAPVPEAAPSPDQAHLSDNAEATLPCASVTISLGAPAKAGLESCTAPCQSAGHTLCTAEEITSADQNRTEVTGSGFAHGSAVEVLEARVLRPLLTATADYCTDDRQETFLKHFVLLLVFVYCVSRCCAEQTLSSVIPFHGLAC